MNTAQQFTAQQFFVGSVDIIHNEQLMATKLMIQLYLQKFS